MDFSETIVVYDIKIGKCSNEYMNLYEFQRSFIDVGTRSLRFNNFFSVETTVLIEAKFHVELSSDGGTKVYSNDSGYMTKMAAMPMYGKYLKISSSLETKGQ